MNVRFQAVAGAAALIAASLLAAAPAQADLSMVVGPKTVVQNEPVSTCGAKAKAALDSVLQNASGTADGWQWLAYGPLDSSGHASAAAAIHCYAVDTGYVVTFTCATQVPPDPQTANALCAKLVAAFGSGKTAAAETTRSTGGGAP